MNNNLTPSIRVHEKYHRERKLEKIRIWDMLDAGLHETGKIYNEDLYAECEQKLIRIWEKKFWIDHDTSIHDIAQIHLASSKKMGHELKCPIEKIKSYFFCTINPKPDVNFFEFKICVDRLLTSKSFLAYEAVYEQKGVNVDTLGSNYHTHIIIRGNSTLRRSHVISKVQNYFKNFVGLNQPDCPSIIDKKSLDHYRKYIRDGKLNIDDKREAALMDPKWRSVVGIDDIYINKNIMPDEEP